MSDEFERELAVLREEVARFVLEVLAQRDERTFDAIVDQISEKVARKLVLSATLNERDQQLLLDLKAAIAGRPPGLEGSRSTAEAWPQGAFGADSRRGEAPGRDPRGGWASLPAWLRNPLVIGLAAVLAGALITAAILFSPIGRPLVAGAPQLRAPSGDDEAAAEAPAARRSPEEGWRTLLGRIEQGPDPQKAAATLAVLCGEGRSRDDCPSFEERRRAWSAGGPQAAAALKTLREAMADQHSCLAPSEPRPGRRPAAAPADTADGLAFAACALSEPTP